MSRDRSHFTPFVGVGYLALVGAYGGRPGLEITGFDVLTSCTVRMIIVVILLLSTICSLGIHLLLLLSIMLLMLLMLHIILQIT